MFGVVEAQMSFILGERASCSVLSLEDGTMFSEFVDEGEYNSSRQVP